MVFTAALASISVCNKTIHKTVVCSIVFSNATCGKKEVQYQYSAAKKYMPLLFVRNQTIKRTIKIKVQITYVPLLDDRAQLVAGHGHGVEIGEDILALHVLADELELPEVGLGTVKISKRDFEDTSLKTLRSDLRSLGPVDQGLSDLAVGEHGGGLNVVPLLAGEGIHGLLLSSLLAHLVVVLSDRHD